MNWYKIAIEKQEDFPFFKDIPKQKPTPIEETEQYQKLLDKTPSMLQDLLDQCKDLKEATKVLKLYKFDFKIIKDIIVVYIADKIYVVDDLLYKKEAHDWIWALNDWDLDNYIDYPDFNKEFWDYPITVYHATYQDNLTNIQENGIGTRDKTRGIENRSTGSAVFTSENPDDIASYGNLVFEINTPLMKQDGYMPRVSKEEPIEEAEKREALAHLIGLQDFHVEVESGINPTTIIFFGDIPPKYLKVL